MAFKFVLLSALLSVASAGIVQPYVAPAVTHKLHYASPAVDAVASTHQNVVRSFGGTVSHHSKSIETPYSSVHKEDTRVSNNVYTPSIAKTVTYAAAAPTVAVYTHGTPVHSTAAVYATTPAPTSAYSHYHQQQELVAPTVYTHVETAAPTVAAYTHSTHSTHSTPVVTKTVNYAAPAPTAYVYQHQAPATHVYQHQSPVAHVYQKEVPVAHVYQKEVPIAHVYQKEAPVAHVYQKEVPVAHVYQKEAPVAHVYQKDAPVAHVYQHHAPTTATTTTYNHGPAASTYTHNAPGVAAYGTSQTVRYSPAEAVSHMSFEGFGTHWGF